MYFQSTIYLQFIDTIDEEKKKALYPHIATNFVRVAQLHPLGHATVQLSKDLCNRYRNTDATNTSLHVDITGFDSATYSATGLQQ